MFTYTVLPDGGDPYELTATSRDVLLWERTHRGKKFGDLAEQMNMGDLYALAHVAAKRQGRFAGTATEFEEMHDLELSDDPEHMEPDPTNPALCLAP